MQSALERLWPYTNELFTDDPVDQQAADNALMPLPSSLRVAFDEEVNRSLQEATLTQPGNSEFLSTGKQGQHTEYLDYILAEMQSVARAHPGANW